MQVSALISFDVQWSEEYFQIPKLFVQDIAKILLYTSYWLRRKHDLNAYWSGGSHVQGGEHAAADWLPRLAAGGGGAGRLL